jgi:hypothetical protein
VVYALSCHGQDLEPKNFTALEEIVGAHHAARLPHQMPRPQQTGHDMAASPLTVPVEIDH